MRRAIIPHLSAPDKNTACPSLHVPCRKPLLVRLGSLVAPNGGNSGCSSSTIRYQTGEEGDDDRDLPEKEEDEEVSPSHPQGHPPSSSFLCVSREEEQEEEEEEDRPRSGQSREHKGEGSSPFATTPQTSFSLSLSLPATGIGSERSSENLDLLTGRRRSLSPLPPFCLLFGTFQRISLLRTGCPQTVTVWKTHGAIVYFVFFWGGGWRLSLLSFVPTPMPPFFPSCGYLSDVRRIRPLPPLFRQTASAERGGGTRKGKGRRPRPMRNRIIEHSVPPPSPPPPRCAAQDGGGR